MAGSAQEEVRQEQAPGPTLDERRATARPGLATRLPGPAPARAPAGDVRGRARRIAGLLAPQAWQLGGFASAEAGVHAAQGLVLRPDVLVALGDPPANGELRGPPLLVVVLRAPGEVAAWLALGARAVWHADGGAARRWLADGSVTAVPPGGLLDVPGHPGLRLPAAEILPEPAGQPTRAPVATRRGPPGSPPEPA